MMDYGMDTRQQSWNHTWEEFSKYAQKGDRGSLAKENEGISEQRKEVSTRETYPTLYPGEVEGENEIHIESDRHESDRHRRDMRGLTDRAKANQQRRERKFETYEDKRIRLAKGENGTRRVSERPEHRPEGGEWELPPCRTDTQARKLIGGQDGRGRHKAFKDEAMDLAHEEKYAGHPILRLFTRPEEVENGTYMHLSKEDVVHMNWVSVGKQQRSKKGEDQRYGGDAKAVRNHIWSMARTGIGRDTQNQKKRGVGTTEKVGN
eukprot:4124100-Pleurochrysis_carterae.AAC.1